MWSFIEKVLILVLRKDVSRSLGLEIKLLKTAVTVMRLLLAELGTVAMPVHNVLGT